MPKGLGYGRKGGRKTAGKGKKKPKTKKKLVKFYAKEQSDA